MKNVIDKIITEVKDAFAGAGAFPSRERFSTSWEQVPTVAAVLHARETDNNNYANLYDYALKRWGSRLRPQPLTALVINVSRAPQLPAMLLATNRVKNILLVDSDAATLENLTEKKMAGVECWQMDLNCDPLPHGPFDLIIAHDALNYLHELTHLGTQIERVLERSGMFIAREYVGENRLQFTDEQMKLVNALLALLPEHLRQAPNMEEPLEKLFAPELADMLRLDPTKAICSQAIEKMIYFHFRIMEEIPLGGTLLAPLLANISECFTDSDADAKRFLQTLLDVEMRLINGGMISSDYKAYIARKP